MLFLLCVYVCVRVCACVRVCVVHVCVSASVCERTCVRACEHTCVCVICIKCLFLPSYKRIMRKLVDFKNVTKNVLKLLHTNIHSKKTEYLSCRVLLFISIWIKGIWLRLINHYVINTCLARENFYLWNGKDCIYEILLIY